MSMLAYPSQGRSGAWELGGDEHSACLGGQDSFQEDTSLAIGPQLPHLFCEYRPMEFTFNNAHQSQIIHTSGDKSSLLSPSPSSSAPSAASSSSSSPSASPCVPTAAWVVGVGACKAEADGFDILWATEDLHGEGVTYWVLRYRPQCPC